MGATLFGLLLLHFLDFSVVLKFYFFGAFVIFTSEEARQLNVDIFETIYFGALHASCELARIHGPYASFAGAVCVRVRVRGHACACACSVNVCVCVCELRASPYSVALCFLC